MPNAKAVGPCGVPIEAYKYCERIRDDLFEVIKEIWDTEVVLANSSRAKFTMIFKNKGSKDDPSKYRNVERDVH